jgi:hypothetical protein
MAPKGEREMPKYGPAPSVRVVAEDLILHKERLRDIAHLSPRIEYVFVDRAPMQNGNVVNAMVKKIGGIAAYLADHKTESQKLLEIATYELENSLRSKMPLKEQHSMPLLIEPFWGEPLYVLQVSEDRWNVIDDKTREALIFHELCHIVVEEDEDDDTGREFLVLSLRGHDFEDMQDVIADYGPWTKALKAAVETANRVVELQEALPFEQATPGPNLTPAENEAVEKLASEVLSYAQSQGASIKLEIVCE